MDSIKEDSPKSEEFPQKNSVTSLADGVRVELMWERSEETLLRQWLDESLSKSKQHGSTANKKKRYYKVFGSISVILPIIFTGLSQLKLDLQYPLIPTIGFICTGVISGLLAFFNFASLYQKHNEYESKYYDYSNMIKSELCKPRHSRIACDVFLKECQLKLSTLHESAPDL